MSREDLLIKYKRELKSLKSMEAQYRSIIDDLRKSLKWWQQNAWKATFLSLLNRVKSFIGRR